MSFDGYERKTTPFLEFLAERAVVFENCSSPAPWTKPSMASILTSQYPATTGVYRVQHRLPDAFVTWPEVLQKHGLYTAGFSANIVMGNSLSNFAQGFDHFVESTMINRADPIRFASGSARKINEHVFGWLDATDHWPMLLYLHSVDPHEEYEPEPEYRDRFADPERHPRFREEWGKLLESRPPIPGLYVTQDNFDRTGIDAASFIEHASNLYDADLLANDDQLRLLGEKLVEDGWSEDFILVITSDHGEEFFEHGGTSHGYSLYEEMLRVPLMIYAPGLLPAGKRIDTPVRSLDLYPTLCELLGIEVPAGLQGRSLVPLIHGAEAPAAIKIFSEHRADPLLHRIGHSPGSMVSVRTERWKLIVNEDGSQLLDKPAHELYDLLVDPGERHDVSAMHPEVVQPLEAEIANFNAAHRRTGPESEAGAIDPETLAQLRALGYVGDDDQEVTLWAAIASGDAGRVRRVLDGGADPEERDETTGVTPLAMAAMRGDLELAKLFLEHQAGVNTRNPDGSTPLHGAAFLGHPDLLGLLLDAGADPRAVNENGDSVLAVTEVPWNITEFLAMILQIPVQRGEVEAGRRECAERLRRALEEEGK